MMLPWKASWSVITSEDPPGQIFPLAWFIEVGPRRAPKIVRSSLRPPPIAQGTLSDLVWVSLLAAAVYSGRSSSAAPLPWLRSAPGASGLVVVVYPLKERRRCLTASPQWSRRTERRAPRLHNSGAPVG